MDFADFEILLLVKLGARFEGWMIFYPLDILEQIRNNFCKSERGKFYKTM